MYNIDLNCDMGESYGNYTIGNDQEIIKYVSSVNIACGFHAGDPATIDHTVKLAMKHHVKIGAHPSLPDLNGFGRRFMQITPKEAYQLVMYQVGAVQSFVKANGGALHHVKPHGALYNMSAKDAVIANAITEAIYKIDPNLTLYGLANSELTLAAEKLGLPVAHEVFADRTYQSDGTLTPRTQSNAVIEDHNQALSQVLEIIKNQTVTATDGSNVELHADTICIHGDNPHALAFLQAMHHRFERENITLSTC